MRKVYNRIERIAGNVITVKASGVTYGELAEVASLQGKTLAEVIRLDGEAVSLQVFAGSKARFCFYGLLGAQPAPTAKRAGQTQPHQEKRDIQKLSHCVSPFRTLMQNNAVKIILYIFNPYP